MIIPRCSIFLLVFVALCALCALEGCSRQAKLSGLVPCEGTVTYKGTPLSEALVTLSPTGNPAGRSAAARTDAAGKFTMTTLHPNDGVAPGDYRVTVSKYEFYGEAPPPQMIDGEEVLSSRPQRSVIPMKYEEANTSGLVLTVPAKGIKDALFELTD